MIDSDNAAEAAVIMLQLVKKSRLSWFENTIKEFETIMATTNMRIVRQGSFAYFLQASNLNFTLIPCRSRLTPDKSLKDEILITSVLP